MEKIVHVIVDDPKERVQLLRNLNFEVQEKTNEDGTNSVILRYSVVISETRI